jgi:hypothetical protein
VFARALSKHPEARFPSCAEFVQELRSIFDNASAATRISVAAATRVIPAAIPLADRTAPRLRRTVEAVLLLALAAAGGALAVILTSGPGHAATPPTTKTVTAAAPPARTVTVTAPASTQALTAPATGNASPTTNGSSLLQQAQALIQAGNYQAALPLLQHAVQLLQGSGTSSEGNADYTLAYTTTQLGSCTGVLPLLDRAQTLLGQEPQIDQLRATCTGPPGHRPGHGHGNGNGQP